VLITLEGRALVLTGLCTKDPHVSPGSQETRGRGSQAFANRLKGPVDLKNISADEGGSHNDSAFVLGSWGEEQ
jgi:hypothetical protein